MMSPTLQLITNQRMMNMTQEVQPQSEVDQLKTENRNLRRKMAMLTAQYIWIEGGSLAKIDQEIRQYGFRLEKMVSGHDPKIVPITKVVKESETHMTSSVVEKRAGRLPDLHEGRA